MCKVWEGAGPGLGLGVRVTVRITGSVSAMVEVRVSVTVRIRVIVGGRFGVIVKFRVTISVDVFSRVCLSVCECM